MCLDALTDDPNAQLAGPSFRCAPKYASRCRNTKSRDNGGTSSDIERRTLRLYVHRGDIRQHYTRQRKHEVLTEKIELSPACGTGYNGMGRTRARTCWGDKLAPFVLFQR